MSTSSTFLLLLRGGISNRELSPGQLQAQIEKYMSWIDSLRRKAISLRVNRWRKKASFFPGTTQKR